MHRLVLVRHAKSDYPAGVADHDRPLSPRGHRDAPALGRWLAEHVVISDPASARIVVSSALRAQQTWLGASGLVSPHWGDVPSETEPDIYEASPHTLRQIARRVSAESVDTVVLVGHNPGMALLALELSRPSDLRAQVGERFPTSSVAVLTTEDPWSSALTDVGAFTLDSVGIPRG